MADLLGAIVPPGLSPWSAAFLVALSFVTSAMTGAMGLGGGMMMLVTLAQLLPPTVVIPVHAVVQVGSNAGRATIMRRHVARELLWPFLFGSIVGVTMGSYVVAAISLPAMELVLGVFVLWATWAPKFRGARLSPPWFGAVGGASSFATMFVGGTGPLVGAFLLPDPLTRHQVVATLAAFMTVQHALKIGAFTALGFQFLPWLPMLVLMVGLGFLGTLTGNRLLDRLPERSFAFAFKIVLTLLALKIVYDGARALLGA